MIEADELWRFVREKGDVWWVRVALGEGARQIAAMVCGGRSERAAQCLGGALPERYREGAIAATDVLAAYRSVAPEDRHPAAGKDAGLAAHVERFWLTARQRCGRFVRQALSFSKCAENHTGALWYFIRHYNASLW